MINDITMNQKKLAEAYILGIPFGLFGVHHFYLKRKFFGILYACTLGLFGLGYLFDLIRMRWLVKHANRYRAKRKRKKMVSDGFILCVVGGLFGAHHYYLGNKKLGLLYTCTLGVFTVGWIVDLFRIKQIVDDHNKGLKENPLITAYVLGASPLGVFGFHHYYMGNWRLGLVYTFTLGIFGIGWVVDLFRMKGLVKAANDPTSEHGMTKITAYILCVSPLGLFGVHHFYLKRYFNGGLYIATLGLFGVGWVFDMLRFPVLYERYASKDEHKYVDEAFIFWMPFGMFGLHYFYLEKNYWGILYACTLGCFGFGWIIDGFRMRSLIKEYNAAIDDSKTTDFRICRPNCKACSTNNNTDNTNVQEEFDVIKTETNATGDISQNDNKTEQDDNELCSEDVPETQGLCEDVPVTIHQ